MNFANILKRLRTKKGLSQRQFAEILNVSPSSITMYEIGQREPNFTLLDQIATYFEVSTDYLLGRVDINTSGERQHLESISEKVNLIQIQLDDLKKLLE